jgi:hypothetical protein
MNANLLKQETLCINDECVYMEPHHSRAASVATGYGTGGLRVRVPVLVGLTFAPSLRLMPFDIIWNGEDTLDVESNTECDSTQS